LWVIGDSDGGGGEGDGGDACQEVWHAKWHQL
jgi:hypothetical protein